MKLKPIDEQIVVLIGASSGIGREAARRFAGQGARVVAAARDSEGLESLAAEINADGGQVITVVADAARFQDMQKVAEAASTHYGGLDTWVHLAAVSEYATFDQMTPEEFERIIQVNLLGQAYGAMAALPLLKRAGRGALIHVSSVESRRAFPLTSAYSASKHGIKGMVEALRAELAHEGVPVSVTEIIPASVNTPLFNKARTRIGVEPGPVPPVYKTRIAADAILYAASHSVRDIVVGGAAWWIILSEKLSPTLFDPIAQWMGFRLQKTGRPKSVDEANNLFEPVQGYDSARGNFGRFAIPVSLYTWSQEHRVVRGLGMAGLGMAVMSLAAGRAMSGRRGKLALKALKMGLKLM